MKMNPMSEPPKEGKQILLWYRQNGGKAEQILATRIPLGSTDCWSFPRIGKIEIMYAAEDLTAMAITPLGWIECPEIDIEETGT